jgi:hypothetical protein
MIKDRIIHEVLSDLVESGEFENSLQLVMDKKIDPYTACDNIISKRLRYGNK